MSTHERVPLTSDQIALVQRSFAQVQPHADQAAALLYGRLFELDPAVQRLFRGEMHAQGRKLMSTLGTVVADLDQPRELQPVIRDLGARHQRFRLTSQQFDTVGAALLWSLQHLLDDQWTPELHAAWERTYTLLADRMMDAAGAPRSA